MPEVLNECVQAAMSALESGFIFRKLGICYDYISEPGQFPRPTLPNPKEVRDGKPNIAGLASGMSECAKNGGLLFDGYLLRLELGIAGAEEEKIFDRLIGGLIRTGTIGQKGYLIRGLTADGRGYYASSDVDSHLLWAFSVMRAHQTAAIALESQAKLKNISSKWISRVERDGYTVPTLNGKPGLQGDLDLADWKNGPKLLAILLVAAKAAEDSKYYKEFEKRLENKDVLSVAIPDTKKTSKDLLHVQIALHMIRTLCDKEEIKQAAEKRMREIANLAVEGLNAFEAIDAQIIEETPDLDWRKYEKELRLPVDLIGVTEDMIQLPEDWRRLNHEQDTVGRSLDSALTLLLVGDKELAEPYAPKIIECIQKTPWDKLWLASAIAPVIGVHARGVELGLWDAEFAEKYNEVSTDLPSASLYMTEDYDETHPENAGHTEAPRKKTVNEKSNRGRRRRSGGRRRKRRPGSGNADKK